jgi:hypothetical protein
MNFISFEETKMLFMAFEVFESTMHCFDKKDFKSKFRIFYRRENAKKLRTLLKMELPLF